MSYDSAREKLYATIAKAQAAQASSKAPRLRLTLERTPPGHDFNCGICGRRFIVDFDDYQGEFDHPPNEPICDDCAEDCS